MIDGFDRVRADRRRAVSSWIAGCLVLSLCAPVLAQSNSLFGRTRGSQGLSPTSQPANGPAELIYAGPPLQDRSTRTAAEEPPPNPALLEVSLIAVRMPEPRRIQVHDPITIVIREDKRSKTNTKLELERQAVIKAEFRKWFRLNSDNKLVPELFPNGTPGIDATLDTEYEGEGKVERRDSLITRIAAIVLDVKPNGTLVLEARKDIRIDEDHQIVTLTGICRAEDVTAQNTILSTQIANLQIDAQHTGPARDAARRGWFSRIWDLIRPF